MFKNLQRRCLRPLLGITSSLTAYLFAANSTNAGSPGSDSGDSESFGLTDADLNSETAADMAGCPNSADPADPGPDTSIDNSSPFLTVWNGSEYVYENDFLFSKPNSAFRTRAGGEKAYMEGLSGDIYIIQTPPTTINGELKLQVRELEPEESFIDTLSVSALDLEETEFPVVDANLDTLHVFDTAASEVVSSTVHHYRKANGRFTAVSCVSESLTGSGRDTMLDTGDELIIKVDGSNLVSDRDYFILVESHFRDWSLGGKVPFTQLEQFKIRSTALMRSAPLVLAGASLAFGVAAPSKQDDFFLKQVIDSHVSVAHADTVVNTNNNSKSSLVVSAQVGNEALYLQTLFPRYVLASKEAIHIPKELIEKAKDSILTLRIAATKRHIVRTATVFSGTSTPATLSPLQLVSAVHNRTGADYASALSTADGTFLETEPGDVVDLTVKAKPAESVGKRRHYVLKAQGFYTPLSDAKRWQLGSSWYQRLSKEDRKLLSHLKTFYS